MKLENFIHSTHVYRRDLCYSEYFNFILWNKKKGLSYTLYIPKAPISNVIVISLTEFKTKSKLSENRNLYIVEGWHFLVVYKIIIYPDMGTEMKFG